MKRAMQLLVVALPVLSLTLILAAARVEAQQAPAPAPAKECNPCITGPFDNWTDADEQRIEANAQRYCKAHPEQCRNHRVEMHVDLKSLEAQQRQDAQADAQAAAKDPNYWAKHGGPGHTTTCFSDPYNPKDPTGNVCIPETWVANGGEPQPGQCYSDPNDPSNRRCVPSLEQLRQATQDGY